MDVLSFIAALVEHLAWPASVLLVAFLFRQSLAKIIPGLQKLKYKDLELEFGKQIEEVKAELGTTPPTQSTLSASPEQKKLAASDVRSASYFRALAEVSPRAAIMEAWIEFEMTAQKATDVLGLSSGGRPVSMPRLFDALRQGEIIGPAELDALSRLRHLRNQVVHGPEPELSADLVADYATALRQISAKIDAFVNRPR